MMTDRPAPPTAPTRTAPPVVLVCGRVSSYGGISQLPFETRIRRCAVCNQSVALSQDSVAALRKRVNLQIWCIECAKPRLPPGLTADMLVEVKE